jgi:hypothetical protein
MLKIQTMKQYYETSYKNSTLSNIYVQPTDWGDILRSISCFEILEIMEILQVLEVLEILKSRQNPPQSPPTLSTTTPTLKHKVI